MEETPLSNDSGEKAFSDPSFEWRMAYPSQWSRGQSPNAQFQLTHSSGCTLTWGTVDTEVLSSEYTQRFDGVGTFYEEHTKDIYIDTRHFEMTSLEQRSQATGAVKTVAVFINNFPQPDSPYNLVLYANQSAISSSCISDFLALLKNIDLKGDLYTINPASNGTIEVAVSSDSVGGDPQWEKSRTVLIFKDQGGDEQVMTYLDLDNPTPQMQLVADTLYFVKSSGQFGMINLVSKQIHLFDLPGIQPADSNTAPQLNAFFVYGENLFYLAGENCLDYLAKCDLSLRAYNLANNSHEYNPLVTGVASRQIMGYDSVSKKLYLKYSDGDAGCSWRRIQEFDFATKTLTDAARISICSGDEGEATTTGDTVSQQKAKAIDILLDSQMRYIGSISVKDGKIAGLQTASSTWMSAIRYVAQ